MNYYPFHIGDYLSATRHLSWEEDAAYRRLLDTYYTTEKLLPLDPRQVCRLVLATTESQREAVITVLREFFVETPEGWRNVRADGEIDAMRDKQQKQRDKANKRWHKQDAERGTASAMPRHDETDAVASKNDADAMPPTPTPTPTPTPKNIERDARASRLPADMQMPDEWGEWCEQNRPDLVPREVFEKFKDFWIGKPGKAGTKLDWMATWRNWVREEKRQQLQRQPAQSFRERDAAIARKRWEEMTGEVHPENRGSVVEVFPALRGAA